MYYYTHFKYKKLDEDFGINTYLVGDNVKEIAKHLIDIGFKPYQIDDSMSQNVVIMRFSESLYRYGTYSCYIYLNRHRCRAIEESFNGAETGIEGWGSASFMGDIESVEDLKTILRLTGVEEKIKEFSPKT